MAARTHSARSQVVARRRAGYVKQSLLQPLGLRHADLDQITRRYLDLYARAVAKVEAYDAWAETHGYLNEAGESPGWSREYFAALNSASRLLSKLDQHLHRHLQTGPTPLERHLQEHYVVDAEVEEVEDDG